MATCCVGMACEGGGGALCCGGVVCEASGGGSDAKPAGNPPGGGFNSGTVGEVCMKGVEDPKRGDWDEGKESAYNTTHSKLYIIPRGDMTHKLIIIPIKTYSNALCLVFGHYNEATKKAKIVGLVC